MDRRLYVLSLIAAVSLPLGILTGLLGVNVGGIPMRDSAYGFLVTCVVLVLLSFGLLYLFRRLRWL
jgi:zinc transporter